MQDAPVEVEPEAAPAQIAEDPEAAPAQTAEETSAKEAKGAKEAKEAKKRNLQMRTVPTSLIKFHALQTREKDEAGGKPSKKARERNEILEGPCGLGCIVIPSCQRLNNIQCFLFFFCILVTSQGVAFGLVYLSIGTFQRENHLSTTENLVLSLTYDISSCLTALFISYYGGRGNIPRWITFSSFLVGLGSLCFAFPYINDGLIQSRADSEDICQEMKIIKACKKTSPSLQAKYKASFILGQIVQGIAATPLYILGVIFIDNSVATHSAGVYLGLMEASLILGCSLGFLIGAPLIQGTENSIFPISIEDIDDHLKWLRTWSMYFGIVSLTAWFTLIPLSCFPHSVRGTAKLKAEKRKQPQPFNKKFKDEKVGTSIKDFFATLWGLMKNPVLICLAMTKASENLAFIGSSHILSVYIENQFVLTHTAATKIAGFVLFPGAALGHLLGGIIVSKLHMSCKALMRFVIATSIISLLFFGFVIFVHCNTIPFAGISEDYDGTGQLGNLTAPCNSYCKCSSSLYSAICGRDNIGYFSPCFAGCKHSKTINNHKTYYNCSCIEEGLTNADDQGDFIDARAGTCDAKCYKLPLFIAFIFSTILFSTFSGVPSTLTILRIVSDNERSLALGLTFVFLRIFGTIPGPIAFKIAGDHSCIFWETDYCEIKGNCWIYNKKKMAYLMVGICCICKVVTVFFTVVAFCMYKYLSKDTSDILHMPAKNQKVKKKKQTNL